MKPVYLATTLIICLCSCGPDIWYAYKGQVIGITRTTMAANGDALFVAYNYTLDTYILNGTTATLANHDTKTASRAIDTLYLLDSNTLLAQLNNGAVPLFDVTDPALIKPAGSTYLLNSECSTGLIHNNVMYTYGQYGTPCGIDSIQVYSIDKSEYWGYIHGVANGVPAITNNTLYVSNNEGLSVVDVSNPTMPSVVHAFFDSTYHYSDLKVNDNVLIGKRAHTLDFFDISNPALPVKVGQIAE